MVEQESSGGVPGGTGGGWGAEPSGSGGGSTPPKKEEPPKPNQWGEMPDGSTGTGAPGAIDRPGEAAEKLRSIGGGASTSQIEQRYAREEAIKRGEGISERFQPFAEKLLKSETAQFAPGARQRLYENVWLRNPNIQPATIYRPYGAEKKQDPYVTPPKDTLTLPKSSLKSTEPNENLRAFDVRQKGIQAKYEGAGKVVDAWAKEDPYKQFAGERLKNFMGLGELGETAVNVGRFGIKEPRMLKESVPTFEQTTQGTKDVLVAGFVTPIKEKGIVGAAGIAADILIMRGVAKGIGKIGSAARSPGMKAFMADDSAMLRRGTPQQLEQKPAFKSPLKGEYEGIYNRQQQIIENRLRIERQRMVSLESQTERGASQRSGYHTSLEKLSPEYKSRFEIKSIQKQPQIFGMVPKTIHQEVQTREQIQEPKQTQRQIFEVPQVQREQLKQPQKQIYRQDQQFVQVQTPVQVSVQKFEQVQQQTQKQKQTNPFRELQRPRRKPPREEIKIRPSFENSAKPKSSKRAKKETIFGFREYTNPIHDLKGFEKPVRRTKKRRKGFVF